MYTYPLHQMLSYEQLDNNLCIQKVCKSCSKQLKAFEKKEQIKAINTFISISYEYIKYAHT